MTDAANTGSINRTFDRARLAALADWLAVGVAVALPWSTTATEIFIVLWLLALLPTLTLADLRRELTTAAGGLPALLWLLGALGMLWADASWSDRIWGLGGFHKLLVIPLLLAHFRRSERGMAAVYGFLASCTALLILSWSLKIIWELRGLEGFYVRDKFPGIPIHDYIAQSAEFMICAFGLIAAALSMLRERRVALAAALTALAALFLANILYISPGRSGLVVLPVLFALFGIRTFGWKGLLAAILAGAAIAALAWSMSPFLRARLSTSLQEVQAYRSDNAATSAGMRLEFWKKSLAFVAQAPILGNGTGSTRPLFQRAAQGESGAGGVASDNPHNQYLAVAVQLGLVGLVTLLAMWVAHLALFRGSGLIPWIGLVVVLQNVIASAFNSHLFDFFQGWLYAFGVGVLGGIVLHRRPDPAGRNA
jgi:hypothetical protein